MSVRRRKLLLIALVAVVVFASATSVSAKPRTHRSSATVAWAPADTAPIHPGVQVESESGQCTANFVFLQGSTPLLGTAAHCFGTSGDPTATNGCDTGSLPLGSPVTIYDDAGNSYQGSLAYSSWLAMHAAGEKDANTCDYNDLALINLPAGVGVNPSVPFWGGPTALNTSGLTMGDQIYSYGNSSLRLGITALSPKSGFSNGDDPSGWSHSTTMLTTGIPGDSGSGLLDSSGNATGVLSTLGISLPDGGTNFFGDLAKELAYAANHGMSAQLAPGTEPFSPLL
jgi:hypothetical protein